MNATQNELHPDDLRALALQLAAFTDLLEQRGQHAVQQTHEAAQQISQMAKAAVASSERITASALEQFRQTAASAVADGMRRPLEDAGRTMQQGTQNIHKATSELELRIRVIGKSLTAHAWKTFVASAFASLAVMGAAVYMGMRAHQDIARAEWAGLINSAIASGKLAPCSDGGLCARMDKKWVRIDR